MNYSHYQLNDFLHDDTFVQWVLYPDTQPQWPDYLRQYPQQESVIQEARQLILALQSAEAEQDHGLSREQLWTRIQQQAGQSQTVIMPLQTARWWQRPTFRWAAGVVLVMGVLGTLWWMRPTNTLITYSELVATARQDTQPVQEVKASTERRQVSLEDGSRVWLEPGSRLAYPRHFGADKREVVLEGEAFFEVARNPNRPFYVYANEVVTKVLGTSFRISAFDNARQVLVAVKTGKVSVYKQNRIDFDDPETRGIVLLPNQQGVFDRFNESLNRRLLDDPLPLQSDARTGGRKFDEVRVSVVLAELERLYGVEILYSEETLANCVLTVTLQGDSLYDQLDIICQTIGATYKEIDAQLLIESKGCQ